MKLLFLSVVMVTAIDLQAQNVTQSVRGIVVDQDSQSPLVGATIIIQASDPLIGSVTDTNGEFRLVNVPIGRVHIKITYIGYEDRIIPNLLITSAKEEVLRIDLAESVSSLEEIVVTGDVPKNVPLNEMSLISSHTFSVEETQRFAGSFDDPARMVTGFAGVVGNAEGDNSIVVRGNSPTGVLWRLEGVAIPNPNHFSSEGSTGGPINALSSKMLSNSDFMTGAFSSEYGNVTSGVFDMKLKAGNNENREYTASISTLGLDMTAEGPFKQGGRASYLANYRYSALDLLDKTGVVDFGGVPRYQDLSFKIQIPVNSKNSFSLFGLAGSSGIDTEEKDENDDSILTGKFKGRNQLGVMGLTHTYQLNEDMYIRTTLSASGTKNFSSYSIPDNAEALYEIERSTINKSQFIAASTFNYKMNARHKIESGFIFTRFNYNMYADEWDFEKDEMTNQLSDDGGSSAIQAFVNWKFRMGEEVTLVSGLHYIRFNLNSNYSVEPRFGLNWQATERQSFNMGVGLHSKLEGVSTYLSKQYTDTGMYTQPNESLGMTKAAHFILGYNNQIGVHTHLKVEAYYQHLYNVPVENTLTNAFSLLNMTDGYTTRTLVNEGNGRNYGVEFTADRQFHNGLYYTGTLSLFRSLYTPMDGIERKSTFDNNYVANLIGGKEFSVGNASKNKVLFLNTKLVLIGGKRYSPIDLQKSIDKGTAVTDESNPFSVKGDDIFRLDFAIGVRRNRRHTSTEWKIDVQNILNNQTVVGEYYVHASGSIVQVTQLGILPTLSYRISF